MATTAAFLATCRTAIEATPELSAFRTALLALGAASRAARPALWNALYDDAQAGHSPALRLRKAIRDAVNANAGESVTALERESTYRDFAAEYAPQYPRPTDAVTEKTELERLIREDQLS